MEREEKTVRAKFDYGFPSWTETAGMSATLFGLRDTRTDQESIEAPTAKQRHRYARCFFSCSLNHRHMANDLSQLLGVLCLNFLALSIILDLLVSNRRNSKPGSRL